MLFYFDEIGGLAIWRSVSRGNGASDSETIPRGVLFAY
jgi:hypothetical protein